MAAKLEMIGNGFDTEPQSPPIPWKGSGIRFHPSLNRLWSRMRTWILPAVCFPGWWTESRASKVGLNIPEYRQPSVIAHEITRRM